MLDYPCSQKRKAAFGDAEQLAQGRTRDGAKIQSMAAWVQSWVLKEIQLFTTFAMKGKKKRQNGDVFSVCKWINAGERTFKT